jgi:ribose transport system substrate-binding protein
VLISAVSDDNALAALDAVQELGLSKNCAIVGHDGADEALRAIAPAGSPFVGTVAFFPEQYGQQLTDLAASILRGERVPPAVHVPHQLITRGNLKQFARAAAVGTS